jgi:hypothetical protein
MNKTNKKKVRGVNYYSPNNVKSTIIDMLVNTNGVVTTDYINRALAIRSAAARLSEIGKETPLKVESVTIHEYRLGRPSIGYYI